MKKLLTYFLALSLLLSPLAATAAVDIWFSWNPNPEIELVSKYQIQQKDLMVTNSAYLPVVTCTTNEGIVRGITGMKAFRVVAINGVGTSDPSAEVAVPTNKPSIPQGFKTK
jgi:hypothetical protein